jgi:hypothetical protein
LSRFFLVQDGVKHHTSGKHRNVVGPQVRQFREYRGWTQTTLAAKCQAHGWNVTRDVIATIESRVRWIGDFELVLLSKILAIPVTDLLPTRINWAEVGFEQQ